MAAKSWRHKWRKSVGLSCSDPSLAIQSQKAEADINRIVRDFGVTGRAPAAVRLPQYGDFDQVDDFQSALAAVEQAEASFMSLPSKVRHHFNHDPQAFLEFCSKEDSLPQLREWGLAPVPEGSARSPDPSPGG